MSNQTQRTFGIHRRMAGIALALAIILVSAVVATGSAQAQTLSVLHSFTGSPGDGASPRGSLVRDAQGNLYGTTWDGGASGGGTLFKVDKTGKETVLYNFGGVAGDGVHPNNNNLVRDTQGNLYSTTKYGGAHGSGTVFKVDKTGKETVLYSFGGIVGGRCISPSRRGT